MEQLKRLVGDTAIYGVSSILGRLLNWLLVPLYVRYYSHGEYALVVELFAYLALFNVLFTFGFETAYFRFTSNQKESNERYFDLAVSSIMVNCLLLGGGLVYFADQIASLLLYEGKGYLIIWCAFILSFDAIAAIPFARLRLRRQGKRFATYKLINICLNIMLNLFFIVYLPSHIAQNPQSMLSAFYFPSLGVGYVFLSYLIANATYLLIFYGDFRKVTYRISLKMIRPLLAYSAPLVVLQLAGMINEMFSRQSLKYILPRGFYPGFTNADILGIFGACFKLSIFMTLAVQAYKFAFEPFFFSNSKEPNSKELYAKAMNGFIIFGGLSWMSISLVLPELALVIFGKSSPYLQGLQIVPVLLGAGLLMGIFYNLSVWYKLTDRTLSGAVISIIGAIITIVLNVVLIPVIGFMGSAWASLVSWLLMSLLSYFMGRKYYPINYDLPKAAFYLIYAAVASLVIVNSIDSIGSRYLLGIGFLIVYLSVVYWLEMRGQQKELDNG